MPPIRLRDIVRAMFYFAQDKKLWAGENPASVGSFDHQSRERYLQPEELPRFFLALRKAPADLRDFVNLCSFGPVLENRMCSRCDGSSLA